MPTVLDVLAAYKHAGYSIEKEPLDELLLTLTQIHAPRGHTSEVAWAIWGHLLFDIPLHKTAVATIKRIDNSVLALLTLNARANGLVEKGTDFPLWSDHMQASELEGEHWLLAYEARIKKWLPPKTKDYEKSATGFSTLGKAGVSFFDETKHKAYVPPSFAMMKLGFSLKAFALAEGYE